MVFICSFFSSIGSFNLPDYFLSSSSSGLPSNLPGGGGSGPNNFKLSLDYIVMKDTDILAEYMKTGLIGWSSRVTSPEGLVVSYYNPVPLTLKDIGMPAANISPLTLNNIAHESEVFRFITNNGYLQLNVNARIDQAMIDSVRALKLNLPQ